MIRKAKVKDIYAIHKLEKSVLKQSLGEDFLLNEIENNPFATYYVIEINKEIIGYLGLRVIDNVAEMMNFVIKTDFQKLGYGTNLLNKAIEENNLREISLEVRKSNKQARRFYESKDFVKSHIRKDYYDNEDGIVYIWRK